MKKVKIKKLFSLVIIFFGLGTLGLTTAVMRASANGENKVETGNKYGYLKKPVFPKSWKGYWGGKSNYRYIIHEKYGDILGNCGIAEYGYVKGTHKYPWQMSAEWKRKCTEKRLFLHAYRRTWTHHNGIKWAILGNPLSKPIQKYDFAITCRTETIKGKKYRVLFEASPISFKTTSQYFRTNRLTKKYGHHQFKDMKYSAKFK